MWTVQLFATERSVRLRDQASDTKKSRNNFPEEQESRTKVVDDLLETSFGASNTRATTAAAMLNISRSVIYEVPCTCASLRCYTAGPSRAASTRASSGGGSFGLKASNDARSHGRTAQTSSKKLARVLKPQSPRRREFGAPLRQDDPPSFARERPASSASGYVPPAAFQPSNKTVDIHAFQDYSILGSLKTALAHYFGESSVPKPSAIQALSLQHFVGSAKAPLNIKPGQRAEPHQVLLGAETGSGKTLAYLLPALHFLKKTDKVSTPAEVIEGPIDAPRTAVRPRALILCPTHELARQITGTAKALSHDVKLRVRGLSSTASGMHDLLRNAELTGDSRIDVLVGTGRSILRSLDRGELAAEAVEWIVIDEADVLLGSEFAEETSRILAAPTTSSAGRTPSIILSTATIPPALVDYLKTHYPNMHKVLSPALHRLPSKLSTRFVPWSGSGNKLADVAHEVKRVIAADARDSAVQNSDEEKSRLLIFCNAASKVKSLEKVLLDKGIPCVAMTGEADERKRGSNGALDAFLVSPGNAKTHDITTASHSRKTPRVLITTSLLSRGLDFAPNVKHVFLLDTPRDVLDFVHRAGRTGRAGRAGDVTIFGNGSRGAFSGGTSAAGANKQNISQWQSSTKLGQELQLVIGRRSFA